MSQPATKLPLPVPLMPRVGVVGAGAMASAHLAAWRELGVSTRIYSTGSRAAVVGSRYGAPVCRDLAELLSCSDVVDVCTPTPSHPEMVAAAARAGRHVICEKPLALTHQEAATMVRVCREAGVRLYPGQVVRYFPRYAAAKAAVDAGALGVVRELRLSRRGAVPVQEWFSDESRSGGVVVDLSIHDFDFARWVAGEVGSVTAEVVHGPAGTVRAQVVLRHVGGAASRVTGEWGVAGTVFATSFVVVGDLAELTDHCVLPSEPGFGAEPGADGADGSPYVTELRELAVAIAGGPAPRVTAADGVAALDVALAALESARTGEPVRLPAGAYGALSRSAGEADDLSDGQAVREPVHPGVDVLEGDRLSDELLDGKPTAPPEVDEPGDVPGRHGRAQVAADDRATAGNERQRRDRGRRRWRRETDSHHAPTRCGQLDGQLEGPHRAGSLDDDRRVQS